MSWLRSAVNKAVEVGGNSNITRTVRNYADTVVQQAGQAVAGGAKIIQNRMGMRNYKSLKQTVKRLEEAAISCRGIERVQLLHRWLFALREIERAYGNSTTPNYTEQTPSSTVSNSFPGHVSSILYFDPEVGGEPMNFRDVFLYSQALEGITLSMILEAPNDDEVSLLLEIFRHCLAGEKEVHDAITSSIQDLAKAFSNYQEEVLVKREELLQFAQNAISGLKLNADITRIEYEALKLSRKVDGMEAAKVKIPSSKDNAGTSEKTEVGSVEALKEALAEVRHCARLEALLLKKKSIKTGESSEIHSQKVDKLKVLADSLANSTSKAEKRIQDHRHQKEEALHFRATKANEVSEVEQELLAEIAGLEKQRDGLEAELQKVKTSLAGVVARLNKTREERDQFDEASTKIVVHLKTKEDELAKSVASCKVEADVVHVWINFLEDTWKLQSSYTELKDKHLSDEVERCGDCFLKLIKYHLSSFKDELRPSVSRIGTFVENLKRLNDRSQTMQNADDKISKESNPRKLVEEEYLATETKIVTVFSVVDHMKALFYADKAKGSRREDPEVKELFDSIEVMRAEFESIERPFLEIEMPDVLAIQPEVRSENVLPAVPQTTITTTSPKPKNIESPKLLSPRTADELFDPESEIAKLEMEFGKSGRDYTAEEIDGWEFDELEQDLGHDNSRSTSNK